ncbi:hypothetical protein AVEN_114803-1 [Araneus ventricosus]|uniref:Uncharacterized protein n=1 Tax=Araneus ventricosus TaxID=182803 RepID=A0A4Y2IKY8_ARAVE|nr:hypothetical protein AVEN_114803-1 [Araneus ventricosus]
MSSQFYTSIIEEEKKRFGITNERLKTAARVISSSYSKNSLKKGSTHLDYSNPECRCAYVYKYANLHAGMVTKYFRKFIRKKEIRNHFQRGIKICSLGGGPGTDIIGIFKALGVIPYFQHRINQVSVLDICGGWSNTFENIISCLLTGKVKDVPETFVSSKKFKHELIEVDLLRSLPENVVEIISNADIISMVKFMSVILAKEGCLDALKVLGNLFKPGAIVLFIDNYQGNVFESIKDILNQTGLEIVLGPLHEVYIKHTKQQNEEIYGCLAQTVARISVVGLVKRDIKSVPEIFCSLRDASHSSWCKQDSVSSDEDESTESTLNTYCDKFVQTELEDCSSNLFKNPMQQASLHCEVEELSALMEALLDLLEVIKEVKKSNIQPKHICCHCHSKLHFMKNA